MRASFRTCDAVLRERRRHFVIVVVIAEDGEDTRWVPTAARAPSAAGADVLPVAPRDVVAAEDDQIRPFGHDRRHRVADIVVRHPAAAMDVGQQPDAQAGQRRRKAGDADRLPASPQLMAGVEKTVRARSGRRRRRRVATRPLSTCGESRRHASTGPDSKSGTGL